MRGAIGQEGDLERDKVIDIASQQQQGGAFLTANQERLMRLGFHLGGIHKEQELAKARKLVTKPEGPNLSEEALYITEYNAKR